MMEAGDSCSVAKIVGYSCASGEPNSDTASAFLWSSSQLIPSSSGDMILLQFLSTVAMAK